MWVGVCWVGCVGVLECVGCVGVWGHDTLPVSVSGSSRHLRGIVKEVALFLLATPVLRRRLLVAVDVDGSACGPQLISSQSLFFHVLMHKG